MGGGGGYILLTQPIVNINEQVKCLIYPEIVYNISDLPDVVISSRIEVWIRPVDRPTQAGIHLIQA